MEVYTLQLNQQQLMVINEGLQLVAFGKVAPLMQEINNQLAAQRKEAQQEPPQPPTN